MARELHPEGKGFRGIITDHGIIEAKSGTPQVFVKIQNSDEPSHNATAFMALTDKAVEWTVKKLRGCGYTGFDFQELGDGTLLAGNQVLYQVEHEAGPDGVIRDKVGWINDPNSSGLQSSDAAVANSARFNEILKQFPPENKPQTPAGSPPPVPAGSVPW